MRGINKVILVGNIGKDPDIQILDDQSIVVKFPLATSETYRDKNGQMVSNTEWHSIVMWKGLAELAQKVLHKGSLIYVEGKLKHRTWEDKDKNKRHVTEVVAENFVMLNKKTGCNSIESIQHASNLDGL
jgi:single-strand DNA-binding protein